LKFGENSPVKETQEGPAHDNLEVICSQHHAFFGMNSFTNVSQSIESFFFCQIESRPGFLLQFCDVKVLEFFFSQKLAKFVDLFT
jgi:hypothetical protein